MITRESLKSLSELREPLMCGEDFTYIPPCKPLGNLISNFTICFPDQSMISDAYTIMPHGSVTLVLFQNDMGLHRFLFGPTTKPHRVGDIANKCSSIFITEFQPAGFFPFAPQNQKELTDKIVPFSLINPSLDNAIVNIFQNSLSADELLLEIENRLMQSIRYPYPGELALALKTIIQMGGALTCAETAKHACYSPRHLNRLFCLHLGMSMKAFSRLVRINHSIQLLNDTTNTLASICETLGYYDVSHLIKDFKDVCGVTPKEYKTNMSDFYSEIAKF